MLPNVGEGAAVVARSAIWWSVDGCRSTRTATTGDATSTTAADNRRHRTLVFRQKWHSKEVTGRHRPAGDESDEWRPRQQRCQCIESRTINGPIQWFSGVLKKPFLSSKRSVCSPNLKLAMLFCRDVNVSCLYAFKVMVSSIPAAQGRTNTLEKWVFACVDLRL